MAANLFYVPTRSLVNLNGFLAAGAELYFYEHESSTEATVYSDSGLTTALSQPIVANPVGVFPTIYLNDALIYRARAIDPVTGEELFDVDPYYPGNAADATDELLEAALDAQNAAAVAQATSNYFPSLAAGEAGTTTGELFAYPTAGSITYAERTAGGSTVIATMASQDSVTAGQIIRGVGLFNALNTVTIPSNTQIILTTGFHTVGKGMAKYIRTTESLPSWGENIWWRTSQDGAKWKIAETTPTSDQFGTYGDAARAYLSQTVTGTDVTATINALTYYAETVGNGQCILSRGAHRTSDTIHVGTGINGFRSVHLIGEVTTPWATRHDNQTAFPSAEIKAERNDRPAVNVQGGRSNSIADISIEGPLYAVIINNQFGRSDGLEMYNDVLASAWLPADVKHTNGRYNPGAGISVDAFSGSAPVGAYPTVAYPVATTQYDKPFSSEISIDRCKISGFSVGIASQPCDADGNGDFLRIDGCSTTECIYAISIGNGQSRNVEISNHNYIHVHTFITNNKNGKQRGKLGGPMVNISGGQSVQLFDLTMGFAGSVKFTEHYSEGLWRLGDAVGQGVVEHHGEVLLTSTGGNGTFPLRGMPRTIFGTKAMPTGADGGGITESGLIWKGNVQVPYGSVIASNLIDTRGLTVVNASRGSGTIDPWLAQGHNALGGGLFAAFSPYAAQNVKMGGTYLQFNVVTGVALNRTTWDGEVLYRAKRATGHNIRAKYLTSVHSDTPVLIPTETSGYDHSSLTSKVLTGTTFTFTLTGATTNYQRRNFGVGDIIWHEASGSLFIISARATDNVTAVLQNGYADDGAGTITFPNGQPTLTEGTFFFFSGRYFLPEYPVFADVTSGSPTLSDVGTAEDYFGLPGDIVNGDSIATNGLESFTFPIINTITASDSTARTITLSGNALETKSKVRLLLKRAA